MKKIFLVLVMLLLGSFMLVSCNEEEQPTGTDLTVEEILEKISIGTKTFEYDEKEHSITVTINLEGYRIDANGKVRYTEPGTYEVKYDVVKVDEDKVVYTIKETLTITVNEPEPEEKVKATFMVEGTQVAQVEVNKGETPTAPADPKKAEDDENTYEFAGWEPALGPINADTAYTAKFTATPKQPAQEEKVKATFMVEGTQVAQVEVNKGETPTAPADPKKAEDDENTYDFAGWEPALGPINQDTTYTAKFTATPKQPVQEEKEPTNEGYELTKGGKLVENAELEVSGTDKAGFEVELNVDDEIQLLKDGEALEFYHWVANSEEENGGHKESDGTTYTATKAGTYKFYVNENDEVWPTEPKDVPAEKEVTIMFEDETTLSLGNVPSDWEWSDDLLDQKFYTIQTISAGTSFVVLVDGEQVTEEYGPQPNCNLKLEDGKFVVLNDAESADIIVKFWKSGWTEVYLAGRVQGGEDSDKFNVTFSVTREVAEGHKMYLAGNMTNPQWGDGKVEMIEGEGHIWTVTIELPAGTYEYKFLDENDWLSGDNKSVTVSQDVVLESLVWENTALHADKVNVTFKVTLDTEKTLKLAGSFNSWSAQAMTKGEGNVWTITLELAVGTEYEYKLVLDSEYELFGQGNRKLTPVADQADVELQWNVA